MTFLSTPQTQLWEPVPNAELLTVLFANNFPFFFIRSLCQLQKRGAERTVHAVGTDGAKQSTVLDFLLPPLISPGVQFLFLGAEPLLSCNCDTDTPHKTLISFSSPFLLSSTPPALSALRIVLFLFEVSSADSVKDKSKSEPEEHPLLFIIAQNQRPAACHTQP